MGNPFQGLPGHSAEHFGDTRDHWWNLDFLELMARRWNLAAVRDVLDVGCGVGHWGQRLAAVLPAEARVVGVDRDARWVSEAAARAASRGLAERFDYRQAEAERLPFPDGTFDLVTCQTVLIHLPDPRAGLAEMRRVAKPGGLVAVAEPNNVSETLLLDSLASRAPVETLVALVRFHLTCERGKIALGEGDSSLGDRVPGLFAALGFDDVTAHTNDKATAIFPPYDRADQRAFAADVRDRAARRMGGFDEETARRYFVAGGGAAADFDEAFAATVATTEGIARSLDDGSYHGIVGGPFYLVTGRKPLA